MYMYLPYPIAMGKMWKKVNFLSRVELVWIGQIAIHQWPAKPVEACFEFGIFLFLYQLPNQS